MKLTKTRLKQLIKEELKKVLQEDVVTTWNTDYAPEGGIEDSDELAMWLNEAGGPEDLTRYGDKVSEEYIDGISEFIELHGVTFPITDFDIANKLFIAAKAL